MFYIENMYTSGTRKAINLILIKLNTDIQKITTLKMFSLRKKVYEIKKIHIYLFDIWGCKLATSQVRNTYYHDSVIPLKSRRSFQYSEPFCIFAFYQNIRNRSLFESWNHSYIYLKLHWLPNYDLGFRSITNKKK